MITNPHFLAWRGIHPSAVCHSCGGTGVKTYSNTSTWRRGGISGQAFTSDVCDNCWGSGDVQNKWTDLRHMADSIEALVQKQAEEYLYRRTGAALFAAEDFEKLQEVLLKESRRHKVSRDFKLLCQCLAGAMKGWGK